MTYRHIAPLLLTLVFVVGCATTEKHRQAVESWIGSDATSLVRGIGYPSRTFTAPNGNTVYAYESSHTTTMPTMYQTHASAQGPYASSNTYKMGGQSSEKWCNTYFEVDSTGHVTHAQWEGNDCKAR